MMISSKLSILHKSVEFLLVLVVFFQLLLFCQLKNDAAFVVGAEAGSSLTSFTDTIWLQNFLSWPTSHQQQQQQQARSLLLLDKNKSAARLYRRHKQQRELQADQDHSGLTIEQGDDGAIRSKTISERDDGETSGILHNNNSATTTTRLDFGRKYYRPTKSTFLSPAEHTSSSTSSLSEASAQKPNVVSRQHTIHDQAEHYRQLRLKMSAANLLVEQQQQPVNRNEGEYNKRTCSFCSFFSFFLLLTCCCCCTRFNVSAAAAAAARVRMSHTHTNNSATKFADA